MKLYEPHPQNNTQFPSVVIDEGHGMEIVTARPDMKNAYANRKPYRGAVRKDSVSSALRGLAWSLGIPNAMQADVPNG